MVFVKTRKPFGVRCRVKRSGAEGGPVPSPLNPLPRNPSPFNPFPVRSGSKSVRLFSVLDQRDGDLVNVLADILANEGCAIELFDRDFVPSDWNAEKFTNVLAESDLNQAIPVHELLGAHVQRLKQLERPKRREAEAQFSTQPVRAPPPRPSCTLGDITLAVSEAGHKFGRGRVVRPVRPPEHEDMVLLRELARRGLLTSDSFERVDICKTINHIQRRVK